MTTSRSPWRWHWVRRALLTIGGDSHDAIVGQLVLTGLEFTLLDPPEMAPAIRAVAARLTRRRNRRS